MKIEIHEEIKSAIKEALTEWFKENKSLIHGIHSQTEDGSNLLTVAQFAKKHPFITIGGLRDKLNFRDYNGLGKCISKAGRKVLIKEKEALEWFSNPPPEANWKYDHKKYGHK
jgi:hypothetical protein